MMKSEDSWARLVREEQEIPESFADFFHTLDRRSMSFPDMIFAPPDRWYRGRTNPKLLCLVDDRIYLAEKKKKQIEVCCFPMSQIIYLEMGNKLLHSWLRIYGTEAGRVTSILVEFNTVGEHLFRPLVEKIRAAIHHLEINDDSRNQLQQEEAKFDDLIHENFKYMNFGKRSLLPGAKVHQILLQPDIRVKFWKYFYRTLSLVHQTILTDKELIMINEGDDSNHRPDSNHRYGGIWRYIPLQKITQLEIKDTHNADGDLYTLSIDLPENLSMHTMFSAEQKPRLDLLRSNFEQTMAWRPA